MLNKYYLYTMLSLLPLAACMQEELPAGKEKEGKELILQYRIEEMGTVDKPGNATNGEMNINSLYILFFDYSTNGSGKLVDICGIASDGDLSSQPAGSIYLDLSGQTQLEDTDYNLLVAANAEYYARAKDFNHTIDDIELLIRYFKELLDGKTEKEVAGSTFFRLDSGSFVPTHLPMSGKAIKRAGSRQTEVKLSRSVSRIDVTNEDERYELISASLWNVFPRINIWDNSFTDYTDEKHLNRFAIHYTDNQSDNKITASLYSFENYVPNPQPNDTLTTCLIVGMRRKDDKKQVEYYRINLHPAGSSHILKRNNLYHVTIRNVLQDGKGNEQDAYTDREIRLSGTIKGWEEDDFSNVQFDGDNILALSFATVNFPAKGGIEEVDILTRGNGEIKIVQQDLPKNIDAKLSVNDKKTTLTINAHSAQDEVKGWVEVQFGNLRATLYITQQGHTSEQISLSQVTLPDFPARTEEYTTTQTIEVTATGPWVARLYNETGQNWFSFHEEDNETEIKGAPGGNNSFAIYLREDNPEAGLRYSFITVSLISNPMVSRMILLTQNGQK
ncbi:MAG: hypothetical protein LUD74_01320 [Tannerellaceae bacterium]|nr:hypothetical protein [Tannerellaceae bacterium]